MTATAPVSPGRRASSFDRAGSTRRSALGFLLLLGLIVLWSIATPLYAAPDEPVQAIKAAGTATGQLRGEPVATGDAATSFVVPLVLIQGSGPTCFARQTTVTADCEPTYVSHVGTLRRSSYVGRYPPLYYVLVGLPTLVAPSSPHLLLYMRFVSAALSAIFLAAAFVSATQAGRRRWLVVGTTLAFSPMEIFLAGVVNPSGLEISSALCLWTSGIALVTGPLPQCRRRLIAWAAISAATLVQIRGLSPVFVAIMAVALAALAGRHRLAALVRRRDVQTGLGVVVLCGLFAVAWITSQHSLSLQHTTLPPSGSSRRQLLHDAFRHDLNLHQMVGNFGWLDTVLPSWCYLVWEAALIGFAFAAVACRSWRVLALGLGLGLVVLLLPTALSYHEATKTGLVGQPRDILPLAVGVPVLAGLSLQQTRSRLVHGLTLLVGLACAVVQVSAFLVALRRYRVGVDGPVFTLHAQWSPPLPWLLLVVAFVLVEIGFLAWWLRLLQVSAGRAQPAAGGSALHRRPPRPVLP